MFGFNVIPNLQTHLSDSLASFVPELIVGAAIVVMLLLRMVPRLRLHMGTLATLFLGIALCLTLFQWFDIRDLNLLGALSPRESVFHGLLAIDNFTSFLRVMLLAFALLVTWLVLVTRLVDEEDSADFFTLLLGSTLGMMLMASANHLLMVFIAVEMASLPSYALVGFLKGKRASSEAALKYVVYGGGASGVMLYGMSLLAGRFGTGYLPNLAAAIQDQMQTGAGTLAGVDMLVLLGLVLVLVGLGFKLAAVPFHFWAPDVFEGASAEVGAFLSVASKAAALALTGRLLFILTVDRFRVPIDAIQATVAPAIAVLAALTASFGNLAAYPQTNLKRLLAYSTIAHAGYMLMGLAVLNHLGIKAVLFYLVAYVLMNLGAFAMVAFIRNSIGSEDLRDMRGLVYRAPWAVGLLSIFLLSLLGLPPLAGFAAKFQVFAALYDAGQDYTVRARAAGTSPALGYTMYALLVIGGINTVVSAFYYLKVLRVMVLERSDEELASRAPPVGQPISMSSLVYALALGVFIFLGGIFWNPIEAASDRGVTDFRPSPPVDLPREGPVGAAGGGAPPPVPPGGARPQPAGGGGPRPAGGQRPF
jgi:NADH-quinone oxidoreductase subunit N